VLVYNRALSAAERHQAEVYLANKYGLYHPQATWPASYTTAVQAEITLNQWTKSQADTYVAKQAANPTMLTNGLQAWYRADDATHVTLSGTSVTGWQDEMGNYDLVQTTAANEPTIEPADVNGKAAIRFAVGSSSQWLSNPSNLGPGLNADMTIIEVGCTTTPGAQQYAVWLSGTGSGQGRGLGYYNNQQIWDTYNVYSLGGTAPAANVFSAEAGIINASHGAASLYHNGTNVGTSALSGVQNVTAGISIGASTSQALGWQGDIAEVLVYDHELSQAEFQQVGVYLANKYGLPLSVPAPTITPGTEYFNSSVTAAINPLTPPAQVRYTLDGTIPTASSPLYSAPLTIATSTLLQAQEFLNGTSISPVASVNYYTTTPNQSSLASAPTNVSAVSISSAQINLSWVLTGSVTYSALNLYRSTNGGAYVLLAVLDPTATSYSDFNVTAANTYKYEVGTINATGISDSAATGNVSPTAGTTLNITVTAPAGAVSVP
jgi:hypothetical protein